MDWVFFGPVVKMHFGMGGRDSKWTKTVAKDLSASKTPHFLGLSSSGAFVAMLIYADDAKTPDRLEDYARLMYPTYSRVNLPTWVIGTPFGNTPESPAYILKVWPEREPCPVPET